MNSYLKQKLLRLWPLLSALTILAVADFSLPQGASAAGVTAGAKIVNVATVEYKGVAGGSSMFANAAAVVNVQLKAAALNATNPPTDTNGNPAKSCATTFDTYSSGRLVSKLIAVTATSNGQDIYNLTPGATTGSTDASALAFDWYALNYDGTKDVDNTTSPPTSKLSSITLGSAIVLDFDAATNKLIFPGGSLRNAGDTANIFKTDDIIIVQQDVSSVTKAFAYLVNAVSPGKKRIHTHESAGPWANEGSDTSGGGQQEELGYITVKEYIPLDITLKDGSKVTAVGGPAPNFATNNPIKFVPAGQMALVELDVAGTGTSNSASGFVVDTLNTESNTDTSKTTNPSCTFGNFDPIALKIEKMTRKFANYDASAYTPLAFAKSASGKPGDIMEYEITITSERSTGDKIKVTDAVPKYTTLVTYSNSYAGTLSAPAVNTDIIAKVSAVDVVSTATIKGDNTGGTNNIGHGSSAALVEDSALAFYLGYGSTSATGGILPYCNGNNAMKSKTACEGDSKTWVTSMTIRYQVKIN